MNARKLQEIRTKLAAATPPTLQEAIELRAQLAAHAEDKYKAKNNPTKTLDWHKANADTLQIRRVLPLDQKVPYVWQLFTKKTAWVAGDTVQECIDRAMTVKKDWSKTSDEDVKALILAHQALQDADEGRVEVKEVA